MQPYTLLVHAMQPYTLLVHAVQPYVPLVHAMQPSASLHRMLADTHLPNLEPTICRKVRTTPHRTVSLAR